MIGCRLYEARQSIRRNLLEMAALGYHARLQSIVLIHGSPRNVANKWFMYTILSCGKGNDAMISSV